MKKVYIFDKNTSSLSKKEIEKFKDEITKQKNSPVCADMSTYDIAKMGANIMMQDGFCLIKGQIDV